MAKRLRMNQSSSPLGCAAMAGAIVFSVIYICLIIAGVIDGQPLNGRVVNNALLGAGLSGFFTFSGLFVCLANDARVAQSKLRKCRRKLMDRSPQTDEEFCRDVPDVDRSLAISLRQKLADHLDVPCEKIYSTDRLHEDLAVGQPFESLYDAALEGRTIFEVATDEVLDIVDQPDHTLQQVAEELRLLAQWTARQRNQQTEDGNREDESTD